MKKYIVGKTNGGYLFAEITAPMIKFINTACKQFNETVFSAVLISLKSRNISMWIIPLESAGIEEDYDVVLDRIAYKFSQNVDREVILFYESELFDSRFAELCVYASKKESLNIVELNSNVIEFYDENGTLKYEISEFRSVLQESLGEINQLKMFEDGNNKGDNGS